MTAPIRPLRQLGWFRNRRMLYGEILILTTQFCKKFWGSSTILQNISIFGTLLAREVHLVFQ
jgi:hypothetical protein